MSDGRSLVIQAPAQCPDCGCADVCTQVGDGFVDLHCGGDHDCRNGYCGWRESHFVAGALDVVIATTYDVDLEKPE